jgi:anti-sigma factor RsiW
MTEPVDRACVAVLGRISAYLDGELEAADCDAIERHCQTCTSCAIVVQGLRETIGLCRGVAAVPIPTPVRRKAQASIRALLERERR